MADDLSSINAEDKRAKTAQVILFNTLIYTFIVSIFFYRNVQSYIIRFKEISLVISLVVKIIKLMNEIQVLLLITIH
jgi:hypothetical protein